MTSGKVAMPQNPSTDEFYVRSSRSSPPHGRAGPLVKGAESTTHYLHLQAFPCKKCKGPVVAGWIGKREDQIAQETNVAVIGGVCLLCGVRLEALVAASAASYFRPVEWEWTAEFSGAKVIESHSACQSVHDREHS